MTIYPVTEKQYKQITGVTFQGLHSYHPSPGNRISVHEDVLVTLENKANFVPTGMYGGRSILGLRIEDGRFERPKQHIYGSRKKVEETISKAERQCESVTINSASLFARSKSLKATKTNPIDLESLWGAPVLADSYTLYYSGVYKLPDKLMQQLEDNLLLLKSVRKETAAERAAAKKQAKQIKTIKSEADDIAAAVTLLKKHGLNVVTVSK